MIDENVKDLIQLYIDNRLDEAKEAELKKLLKSDKAAKHYYQGLLEVQKKVKKLEHKTAFNQFAERWPKRVRTAHEKKILRARIIRVASSAAAVAFVAFVGIGLLRSGVGIKQSEETMAYDMVAEESVSMTMADEATVLEREESADSVMAESEPALAAEQDNAAGSASAADSDGATDSAAEDSEEMMPKAIYIVEVTDGDIDVFYESLLTLTLDQEHQPIMGDNEISLFLTEENYDQVMQMLYENNILLDELQIGMTLILKFN